MGRDVTTAAGDQGAGAVHGLHGVGHEPRLGMGAAKGRSRGRPANGTGREHIPELEVGSERFGYFRPQLRQLGRVGFPREEVCRFASFSMFWCILFCRRKTAERFPLTKITGTKLP